METSELGTHEDRVLRRLYLQVILRAVEEARGINLICGRRDIPAELQRMAREWLTVDTADFRFVCRAAGVDVNKLLVKFGRKYGRERSNRGTSL